MRVKVLQEIYAYHQAEETDVLAAERRLLDSVDNLYGLFIRQLTFWVEVRHFAERRIEENLHKNFPTEEDLNPNRKFVNNRVLKALEENKDLQRLQQKYKISWMDDREDFIRSFYNRLREFPEYQEYMKTEKSSFDLDKKLILDIIDNHMEDDELLFDYYADKNIFYNSDYSLGLFLLWKFINEMDARFDADSKMPPVFKTETEPGNDDKNFVVRLFRETLNHAEEYKTLMMDNISNWDYDRIALMDKIIIFMALTEFCQFRDIPVKVTINEYIEISKYFSTPDSRRFVNGILDKLAEKLKAEKKLVKSGRGLATMIVLLLVLTLGVHAQTTKGTYAFLRSTNSARVAALGGLPLPMYDGDIQLSTFNPAAIDPSMHNKIGLSYVDYYADINFATAQYARDMGKIGHFAATVQYHNYGRFNETSESGMLLGEFHSSEFSAVIGWGRALSPHWSIGAAIKYAGIQHETYSAGALAVDVAGMFRTDNQWIFSLTARNLGVQLFNNFDNRDCALPFSLDFGVSKRLDHLPLTIMVWYNDIQKWSKTYTTPLDVINHTDPMTGEYTPESGTTRFFKNLACHLVVGGELYLGKNFVLRGAFNYGKRYDMDVPSARTLVGFSAGFAVRIKMFEISYARSRDNVTMAPNFITLTLDLNKF